MKNQLLPLSVKMWIVLITLPMAALASAPAVAAKVPAAKVLVSCTQVGNHVGFAIDIELSKLSKNKYQLTYSDGPGSKSYPARKLSPIQINGIRLDLYTVTLENDVQGTLMFASTGEVSWSKTDGTKLPMSCN